MSDFKTIRVHGVYIGHASGYSSSHWNQICADHELEFPRIHQCHSGTLNVELAERYEPPDQERYKGMARARGAALGWYEDGNHISPSAKVIEINGKAIEAWIYCGGHNEKPVLELVSEIRIAHRLSLNDRGEVTLLIREVPEGSEGMPSPPPRVPGKILAGGLADEA